MATVDSLPYPPKWINKFIFQELQKYTDIGVSGVSQLVPIFATSPTNTEDIYRSVMESTEISEPLVIIYDRLITFRPSVFYPHKREQLIYYLYSTSLANVNNANIVISQLLDREDASAEELNSWCALNKGQENFNVAFHNTKVYQAQEARDVLDLASARTMFVNKLIIEYDYHTNSTSYL